MARNTTGNRGAVSCWLDFDLQAVLLERNGCGSFEITARLHELPWIFETCGLSISMHHDQMVEMHQISFYGRM